MNPLPRASRCFLSCSSYHRYLHSFPTRRSSDLVDGLDRALEEAGITRLISVRDKFSVLLVQGSTAAHAEDRKSTRLNSSHRCISYAVFCLKKKRFPAQQSSAP